MSFLASLAAKLIEKLFVWLYGFVTKWKELQRSKKEAVKRAEDNSKKYENSNSDEERRRAAEDLLNGRD